MSRWFRHYAGMMRDEKLVGVAVRSRQTIERVVWIWGAILESAAEIDDAGRYELDTAEAAYFLRADESDICAVVDGLTAAGRLVGSVVAKWSDRQYQSDTSAERQARYRERKKKTTQQRDGDVLSEGGDVTVTSRDGEVTAQETDTDTDTVPNGTAAPIGSAEPDYRHLVWTETVQTVSRLFGKPEAPARSFVGKCLKEAKDDARLVWSKVRQAEADRVVDPAAWIAAAVRSQPPPSAANDLTASIMAFANQHGAAH